MDINELDIQNLKDKMSHIKMSFNICHTILSSLFNHAEKWKYRARRSNPCLDVAKYKEHKRNRFLKGSEFHTLQEVLASYASHPDVYRRTYACFLHLLVFTGCRRDEIRCLRWDQVDFEIGCLRLGDTKVGARTIPLNQKALDIICSLPRHHDSVFHSCRTNHCINPNYRLWHEIREKAGLSDVRLHDLRHSFASFAINSGTGLGELQKLLGHKDIKTTMRYAHLTDQRLKEASSKIFQHLT